MMLDVFSEHKAVIGNLLSLHTNNQLPHAVLITSVSGSWACKCCQQSVRDASV